MNVREKLSMEQQSTWTSKNHAEVMNALIYLNLTRRVLILKVELIKSCFSDRHRFKAIASRSLDKKDMDQI